MRRRAGLSVFGLGSCLSSRGAAWASVSDTVDPSNMRDHTHKQKGLKRYPVSTPFSVNYVINLWCLWNVWVVWGHFSFCCQVSCNRPCVCSSKDKKVCDVISVLFPTTASALAFLKRTSLWWEFWPIMGHFRQGLKTKDKGHGHGFSLSESWDWHSEK